MKTTGVLGSIPKFGLFFLGHPTPHLLPFPAFNICRLKLLSIYNKCLRPFWALTRGGLWPRKTPPLERGASELPLLLLCLRGAPSTVRQFALDQLQSSLLLTSFKVWATTCFAWWQLRFRVSSWWVIADENLGEAVNSFRLQSLWTGTFHHGPKAQGTPLIVVELESCYYWVVTEKIVIQGTTG